MSEPLDLSAIVARSMMWEGTTVADVDALIAVIELLRDENQRLRLELIAGYTAADALALMIEHRDDAKALTAAKELAAELRDALEDERGREGSDPLTAPGSAGSQPLARPDESIRSRDVDGGSL